MDCFAYNARTKKPTCTALIKLDCDGCPFYKSKEQAIRENIKCRERCESKGIKYKSFFRDEEIIEIMAKKA